MATYNNLEITDFTKQKRQQIKALQDEFMTFSWRGFDAFENFGAFIINDKKGSLKFYNGPSFSNEYTKPQFEANAGELMGVTFNRNVIGFTVGVYWISIEHYRLLLNWLDPLITDYICFGFEPNFRYNVKLSKIGDSTRWVVGKENGKPMYYTELNLSFEVQGVQCAKGMHSYEWSKWEAISTADSLSKEYYTFLDMEVNDFIESDLPTPVEIIIPLDIWGVGEDKDEDIEYNITLSMIDQHIFVEEIEGEEKEKTTTEEKELYNVQLCNLTHTLVPTEDTTEDTTGDTTEDAVENSCQKLNLKFNSETGLLFLQYGNSTEKLLTLLTTNDSGQRIVKTFSSSKFFLPGKFEYYDFYAEKDKDKHKIMFQLKIKKTGKGIIPNSFFSTLVSYDKALIICYPRTNII